MLRTGSSVIGRTVCAMPSVGEQRRDLRQCAAGGQASRPQHVRRQIAVAELEPGLAAEPLHRRHEIPGFAGKAPAALRIVLVGQRVEHRVDVGRDVQAEMDEIVRGVDDDGKLVGRQHGRKTARELAAADAAGQCEDEALVRHRACLSAEQVERARSRIRSSADAIRAGKIEPAQQHDRRALAGLAHQQRGRGRDLVGDADLGRAQLAAEQVGRPAQIEQRWRAPRRRAPRRPCRSATRAPGCR